MPHFFKYAKGYTSCMPINETLVNKLQKFIVNRRLSFKNFSSFDYKTLMRNPKIQIDEDLIDTYILMNRKYHFKINPEHSDDNVSYIRKICMEELERFHKSAADIADMLVQYLYGQTDSKYKRLLWLCYGNILLENIRHNVDTSMGVCMSCGKRFHKESPNHQYCGHCFLEKKKGAEQKIKICKDCGTEFLVHKSVRNKPRCEIGRAHV